MTGKTFERTPKDLIIGIAMTLCGGVLWGVNATVFSKILMGTYHASPLWIACVRELAAGVLFAACSAIMTPKLLTGALRDRKSYPRLLATAIICVLLVQVAYLESINWTNSGTATVLQSLNLLFVLGVVCLRGRRLPGVREGIGVALAFAGTVLIATGGDFTTLKLPLVGLIWGAINAASTAAMVFLPVKLIERWGQLHRQRHRISDFRACAAAVRAAVGYGAAVGLAGCGADGVHRDRRHIRRVLAVHGRRGARRFDARPPCSAPANR